ncbi:hypothetical protein PoB_006957100 [Plakobranchus ocellatus]|uniref:Uncharacterized protein n=1 Tax=Plakobranchus ocellatus TaxID=259542 RepID=A0AAV4DGR9_9GAST|nr:hypothetical protein PoB_006957100 [Plakobranchus ocellatus]
MVLNIIATRQFISLIHWTTAGTLRRPNPCNFTGVHPELAIIVFYSVLSLLTLSNFALQKNIVRFSCFFLERSLNNNDNSSNSNKSSNNNNNDDDTQLH